MLSHKSLALVLPLGISIVAACASDADSPSGPAAGDSAGTGGSGHDAGLGGSAGTAGGGTGGGGAGGALPEAGLDATEEDQQDAPQGDGQDDVAVDALYDGATDDVATDDVATDDAATDDAATDDAADASPCTVEVVFEVDVTGSQIPLSSFVTITDPPPPGGTGVVHIAGNLLALGEWTPNTVAMHDDGTSPDATAGDGIWTFALAADCGSDLQYKYTCGHTGDGWAGTEEYPLTNRGYTLPSGCSRVLLQDVFADRPSPSGTLGMLTDVQSTCP